MTMPRGFVYILTNKHHTTLYVEVTSNLRGRTNDHRNKRYPKSFSARYNVNKLVYYEYEVFNKIVVAIAREKQLKAGPLKNKETLINKYNPAWKDLFDMIADEKWNEAPLEAPR